MQVILYAVYSTRSRLVLRLGRQLQQRNRCGNMASMCFRQLRSGLNARPCIVRSCTFQHNHQHEHQDQHQHQKMTKKERDAKPYTICLKLSYSSYSNKSSNNTAPHYNNTQSIRTSSADTGPPGQLHPSSTSIYSSNVAKMTNEDTGAVGGGREGSMLCLELLGQWCCRC
jgi:hypothetical protein